MPIPTHTLDRLTSGLARVVRSGRHPSVRAADSLDGDLVDAPLDRATPRRGRATVRR